VSLSLERLGLAVDDPPVPDDDQRRAAVAAILADARVLLMVRAAREGDPWSGHISLPGGGYQRADRTLRATAIRETREEIGVELAAARCLGSLPALAPLSSGPQGMQVTPFLFVPALAIVPALGPEAVGTFWLPLDAAAAGAFDGTYLYPKTNYSFPCWNFEGHLIWGLTYRILRDLLARATSAP
jgi:8-oxo-dGTP pyrophosphatase MutT (NUDIX family)